MWVTAQCCQHEIKSGRTTTGKGPCTGAFYDSDEEPSCTCQETAVCHVLFQPKQDLLCHDFRQTNDTAAVVSGYF